MRAQAGARVAGVRRSSMEDTRGRIEGGGGAFHAITADLSTIEPAQRIIEDAVAWSGRADILVNNAGIIRRADPLAFTEKDWDDVMNVNLKAYFFQSQAFARHVFEKGGGGRSSTSPRSCHSKAASGFRLTRRAKAASPASHGFSPTNGPPKASM